MDIFDFQLYNEIEKPERSARPKAENRLNEVFYDFEKCLRIGLLRVQSQSLDTGLYLCFASARKFNRVQADVQERSRIREFIKLLSLRTHL